MPIQYRPFDVRYTYYTGRSRGFHCMPRGEIMRHMLAGENVGLVVPKRVELAGGWRHVLVTDLPIEHVAVSMKTIDYLLPLYLYPDPTQKQFINHLEPGGRRPNLEPKVVKALKAAYGRDLAPEAIFCYVYAILHAETYREKYAEFLKMDFPRVPFTTDFEQFEALAGLGKQLVDLHLLRSKDLDAPLARFQGQGDNRVARNESQGFRYDSKEQRLHINTTQYFEPVPIELWEYPIGGYQVLAKWLKDPKRSAIDDGRDQDVLPRGDRNKTNHRLAGRDRLRFMPPRKKESCDQQELLEAWYDYFGTESR